MLPTLNASWDILLEDCISVRLNPTSFRRGELIAATSPLDPSMIVCKRVAGLPGDTICVDPLLPPDEVQYVTVPKGCLWIVGDNSSCSNDSRIWTP